MALINQFWWSEETKQSKTEVFRDIWMKATKASGLNIYLSNFGYL